MLLHRQAQLRRHTICRCKVVSSLLRNPLQRLAAMTSSRICEDLGVFEADSGAMVTACGTPARYADGDGDAVCSLSLLMMFPHTLLSVSG